MFDFGGDAAALYMRAKLDPSDPPGVLALAASLLGPSRVREVAGLPVPAMFVARTGMLLFRAGLPLPYLTFVVAHELAEMELHRLGYRLPDREDACDNFAASLIAPIAAFRSAYSVAGRDLSRLARAFVTSETIVALRIGETTGRPVCVVKQGRIRYSGEDWGWPSEQELRDPAVGPRLAETARIALSDAPRRAALIVCNDS